MLGTFRFITQLCLWLCFSACGTQDKSGGQRGGSPTEQVPSDSTADADAAANQSTPGPVDQEVNNSALLVYEPGLDSQRGDYNLTGTIVVPYTIKKNTTVILRLDRQRLTTDTSIFEDPPFNGQDPALLTQDAATLHFELRGFREGKYRIGFAIDIDQDGRFDASKGDLEGWYDGTLSAPIIRLEDAKVIEVVDSVADILVVMKKVAPPPLELYYSDQLGFLDLCQMAGTDSNSAFAVSVKEVLDSLGARTCEEADSKYALQAQKSLSIVLTANTPGRFPDLRILTGLKDLQYLRFSAGGGGNLVSAQDFTPLTKLTKLTNLSLSGVDAPALTRAEAGEMGFWASVAKIPSLKVLVVSDVRLIELTDKIEGLSQLPHFEELRMTYTNLTDIAPLSALTQLKSLSLFGNDIADFSHLTALKQLNSLTIAGNRRAMSYGFLSSLSQLQSFDASYISGVSGALDAIRNSPKLQYLHLTDANISIEASQLNVLADLRELHLRGNPMSGAINLNLPKLEYLDLGATGISTFPTIASPIKTLLLGNNQLVDASFIVNFPSLVSINLSKNSLSSLPSLASLTELEYLQFDENSVAVLPELGNKPKLRMLSAKQNQLTDVSSILRVTGIVGVSLYLDLSINLLPLEQQVCPPFASTCKY